MLPGAVVGVRGTRAGRSAVKLVDALGGAEDGPADRLVGKGRVLQQVVGDLVRAVAGGGDLLQDHLALALELVRRRSAEFCRMSARISSATPIVALEHAGEIGGGLQAGGGIELAADLLDLLGDVAGRCAARVPLKAMCSRRCEMPCSRSVSWRAPAPTQTPSDTVSRCGMLSVTTRRPFAERRELDGHAAALQDRARQRFDEAPRRRRGRWRDGEALRFAVSRPARRGGSAGRSPVIACMASGNLAGCAVASTTCGRAAVGRASRSAATMPQAVCGSSR